MKNLIVRSLSGAVYVALIVCSILFGGDWAFPGLCCIFAFIGIMEFQKMTQTNFYENPRTLFADLLIGVLIPVLVVTTADSLSVACIVIGIAIGLLVLVRLVAELYVKREDPLRHIAMSIMSVMYVAVPLGFATVLLLGNRSLLLLMFVMIWLNDTGAFLVGSALGSHRLFARHSPKKSWEGFFGGVAFCIAAGCLAKSFFPHEFAGFTTRELAVLGTIVSVMATWGDLFESMIKRQSGVKDSGNIIPGHGGILDRIDSLLFVAPATAIFCAILLFKQFFTVLQGA